MGLGTSIDVCEHRKSRAPARVRNPYRHYTDRTIPAATYGPVSTKFLSACLSSRMQIYDAAIMTDPTLAVYLNCALSAAFTADVVRTNLRACVSFFPRFPLARL